MQLVSSVSRLVSAARAMTPQDLVAPGDTPGSIDTTDLQSRADAAEAQLRTVATALRNAASLDASLLAAANFGVRGAVPSTDETQWAAQAMSAFAEMDSRVAALDKLVSGFTRAGVTPDALRDQDTARLKAIFGNSFKRRPR
jgi:hypothetical protein